MVLVQEQVHPQGLSFSSQRQVVIMRDVKKIAFAEIAKKVVNLEGEHPSKDLVRRVYQDFNRQAGRRKSGYDQSGRKAWKVTLPVKKFLEKRLLALRKGSVCTSSVLQKELAAKKKIHLEVSTVRKTLNHMGYYWMPRSSKRLYDKGQKLERLGWARPVSKMSAKELDEKLGLAMDGIVLTVPPGDAVKREAFCKSGDTHVWRKKSEALHDDTLGKDSYGHQIPKSRTVPLWGGVSSGGCAVICFHKNRKLTSNEWAKRVDAGKLTTACKTAHATRQRGPWQIICDGEAFLHAPASRAAYKRAGVKLWQIPAYSPDLNPVEKFWSWLRRKLRRMDLADLIAKRPPVTKAQLQQRVRKIMTTKEAKTAAANCARGLKRVCQMVVKNKGGATRG